MASHSQINAVVNPIIFREYIGVKDFPDSLDDFPEKIINDDIQQFHFILGFGREDYKDGKGTGNFKRTWNFDYFSPAKIAKLKKDHTNVKVIISIGGYGVDYPFDPSETDIWVTKATDSIKELIQDYENYLKDNSDCGCDIIIDGIDINYEYIKTDKDVFSTSIGKVIKKLKHEHSHVSNSMKVVSIAPTELVQTHYAQLYSDYKDIINWVGYKFYDQTLTKTEEFVSLYNQLLTEYGTEVKLLAGVSTDPDSNTKMKREVFVQGCTSLLKTASLPGIFVWNANDSATPSNEDPTPYLLEEILQNLLTKE